MMRHGSSTYEYYQKEVRQDWLDWLRAIAILLVLGSHYQVDWWDAGLFRPWAQFNMRFGWSGVDMFFVISGFLIGGLLINEQDRYKTIDLKSFYIRRATRIWPLLYVVPLVYIAFFYRFSSPIRGVVLAQFLPTFFHVQNFFFLPLGHLWSLAVEEHFYLILPIVLYAISKYSNSGRIYKPLLSLLIGIIAAVILIRVSSVYYLGIKPGVIRVQTQYRLDGLLIGVGLACIYNYRRELWDRVQNANLTIIIAALSLWPFALNPNHSLIVSAIGLSVISILYSCLIFITLRFSKYLQSIIIVRNILVILAWIGRRSYPIYLFHPFVWLVMVSSGVVENAKSASFVGQSVLWIVGYVAFVVASVLVGATVAAIVEKPLLSLRNKLVPARTAALIK